MSRRRINLNSWKNNKSSSIQDDDSKPVYQERKPNRQNKYKSRKNSRKSRGGFKYGNSSRAGKFYSRKTNTDVLYRSIYELEYLRILESDNNVLNYVYEPFQIPYIGSDGKEHKYFPDLFVLYKNGDIELIEIKPAALLKNLEVKIKATAAIKFLKENYKIATFRFVTEEEIFGSEKEYREKLKEHEGTNGI